MDDGGPVDGGCTKRTATEKVLCVLLAILLCISIILVVLVVYFAATKPTQDICLTTACALAAAKVLNAIDFNVNPCENFYDFACGRWMQRNIIPEDKSYHTTFTSLRDEITVLLKGLLEENRTTDDIESVVKAKDLYKSCMNTDLIEKRNISVLLPVLTELGGWPVLGNSMGGNWSKDKYNLNDLLSKLMRYYNHPLLNMYPWDDYKQHNKTIIYVDQPGLLLPSRDYYLKGRDNKIMKEYERVVKTIGALLGASTTDIDRDIPDIVDFEIGLAKILSPRENRRDNEKRYNPFKLEDLNKTFGVSKKHSFSIEGYLRKVFAMDGVNITLNNDEVVIVQDMNFTSQLVQFLDEYPPRTLANYVILRFVRNRLYNLPKRFTDLLLQITKMLEGKSVASPRWIRCTNFVVDNMGLPVGRLFVQENFAPEAKAGMSTMIQFIKASFNDILHEIDWMDDETNVVAQQKIEAMSERIGYDESILNDTVLNKRYGNVSVDKDFYFENVLRLLNGGVKESMQRLRFKPYRLNWETSPSIVNAFYSPLDNRIMFPAGILQQPYFHKDQPWSLNFGAIGTLVGHEITHGFDDAGRQFDKDGHLNQWWHDEAVKRFTSKAKCFIDQYGNFRSPEAGGMRLNGYTTLGENIADNGGIKQSFRGYKKWLKENDGKEKILPGVNLTNDKLFFIAYAQCVRAEFKILNNGLTSFNNEQFLIVTVRCQQETSTMAENMNYECYIANWIRCSNIRKEDAISNILTGVHSQSRFRIIGTLQNYKEFSNVYNCPIGSYMNPVKKCSVW